MKKYAEIILFILIIFCLSIPVVKWHFSMDLTAWEVLSNTWLWVVYAIVVYIVGFVVIHGIEK